MSKIPKSVNLDYSQGSFTSPYGSVQEYTQVVGTGGSVRHEGYFSESNPHLKQLKTASKNQDKDALYEFAIKWEADQANYQQQLAVNRDILEEQREYDRAVLEEQREYDSPLNDIARKRAAGINPDLSTGSSSGSSSGSAQLAQREMPVPERSTTPSNARFSNAYDNSSLVMQGFQTAASVLSSISGFGSSVVSALDTLKTLPARSSLLDSQADVANRSRDSIVSLQQSGAIEKSLGLISQLGDLFTPDSKDEDISALLTSIGYGKDSIAPMTSAIRQYHSNPAIKARVESDKRRALEAEMYNREYTPAVVGRLVTLGRRMNELTQRFDYDAMILKNRVQKYLLADKDYSSDVANNIMDSAELASQRTEFSKMQLEQDVKAYVNNLADVKRAYLQCEATIASIYNTARSEKRAITPAEKAIIDAEQIKQLDLEALGSNELHRVYEIMRSSAQQQYMSEVNMTNGEVEMTPGIQKHQIFTAYTFQDFVKDDVTTDKLVSSILSLIPGVGGLASDLYRDSTPQHKKK